MAVFLFDGLGSSSLNATEPLYVNDPPTAAEWWKAGSVGALGLATLGVATLAFKIPTQCQWCQPSEFDLRVRDLTEWQSRPEAALISDIVVYGFLPVLSAGVAVYALNNFGRVGLHVLTILDSVLLTLAATEILKRSVARSRPENYFSSINTGDGFMSFPSGHSAVAFALVGAASTIAFYEGYSWAPYVVFVGAFAALSTAYLRVAAGKHWSSDVLTGMAIGSAIGVGVPLFVLNLNRGKDKADDQIAWNILPMFDQTGMQLSLVW